MKFISNGLCFVAAFVTWVHSETVFVGAEKCKLCHRSIYESWSVSDHRGASETLARSETDGECARCHTTGPMRLPGVQCESCHGAGANYWPAEIMMDKTKAIDAGLIMPAESTCRNCHGSGLPNHSPSFNMPSKTDWPQVVHK